MSDLRAHEFDGIREFDNRLPQWWLWTFYLACIFSLLYWVHYHMLGTGDLPLEAYQKALEAAAAKNVVAEVSDESLTTLAQDRDAVAAGKEVWTTYCVACHKPDASGLIGPNLTDRFWLHGGRPVDIHRVITKGVIEKGMAPWETILGPTRIQQVAAFVLTLRNTDVPGGKEPQGEPYDGN
jgi:cytochrome c oxidase cbb3-type subunit 3